MSAREEMLGRIRQALGVSGQEVARNAAVDERLRRAARGVIPRRGQLPVAERVALFAEMAAKVSATVAPVDTSDGVPEAIAGYLRECNLPLRVRMGEDLWLAALPWAVAGVAVSRGPSHGDDAVGVSHALAGVAETGTLVLVSGRDNPTTLAFLPATHIVVVRAADIVGDYEAAWSMVRAAFGKGAMPRTVNWITGPSRSADIEQTLLLGAHGPQRLHILVAG